MPLLDKLLLVRMQLAESAKLKQSLSEMAEVIANIASEIAMALKRGNKVLLCGNGGSAADAQHIAAELAGKFKLDRPPLAAIALTANTSVLTALANDFSYAEVFSRQVQALAASGDVLVGISTSGNSANVIAAMVDARNRGAIVIAFTGGGGKMMEIADLHIAVPSTDTPRIQEAHILVGHIVCHLVEEELFGGNER